MIAFLQANALYSLKESIKTCTAKTFVIVGDKEIRIMKKSSQFIHQTLQYSTLKVLPKLAHGEFSINHAEEYAKIISMLVESE